MKALSEQSVQTAVMNNNSIMQQLMSKFIETQFFGKYQDSDDSSSKKGSESPTLNGCESLDYNERGVDLPTLNGHEALKFNERGVDLLCKDENANVTATSTDSDYSTSCDSPADSSLESSNASDEAPKLDEEKEDIVNLMIGSDCIQSEIHSNSSTDSEDVFMGQENSVKSPSTCRALRERNLTRSMALTSSSIEELDEPSPSASDEDTQSLHQRSMSDPVTSDDALGIPSFGPSLDHRKKVSDAASSSSTTRVRKTSSQHDITSSVAYKEIYADKLRLYGFVLAKELGTTTASPDNLRKKYLQTRANAIARRERTKSDISAETIQRATQLRSSAISRRDLKADPVRPSPLLSDSNVEATRQRLASFDLAGDTLREHGECPKPQRNNSVTSSRRKISEPFGFSRNGNGRQSEVRVLYRTKSMSSVTNPELLPRKKAMNIDIGEASSQSLEADPLTSRSPSPRLLSPLREGETTEKTSTKDPVPNLRLPAVKRKISTAQARRRRQSEPFQRSNGRPARSQSANSLPDMDCARGSKSDSEQNMEEPTMSKSKSSPELLSHEEKPSCRIRSAKSIERFENAKKKQDSRKEQLRSFDDILERSSKLIRKEKQRSQSSSEI